MYKENGISKQAAQLLYTNRLQKIDAGALTTYYEALSIESKKREIVSLMLILASAGCMDPEESLLVLANLADDRVPTGRDYLELTESVTSVLSDLLLDKCLDPGMTVH